MRPEHLNHDQMAQLLNVAKRTVYRICIPVTVRDYTRFLIPEAVKEVDEKERLLKPSHVAKILNVHKSWIYRHYHEDKLKGVQFGNPDRPTLRIFESHVKELLEEERKRAYSSVGRAPGS